MTPARTQRFGLAGFALAASACTATPTILPTNDLNRPSDVAFMCLGAFGQQVPDNDGGMTEGGPFTVSGRPMRNCHKPPIDDNRDPTMQPTAGRKNRTYMFVPNSASGDLSVVDADTWRIVDLDKSTGGFGRAPLGALPEQMSASTDGCRLVTANRGSCDLSFVDPSMLLASTFAAQYNSASVNITVPQSNGLQRITPHWSDGTELKSAPYEAVFLPRNLTGLDAEEPICNRPDAAPWRAIVTYPSCDLVTLIDLPTGNITTAMQVQPDGNGGYTLKSVDSGTASCPVECDASDAGVSGTTVGKYGPTGIAIFPRGEHAYVSLAKTPAILSIALTPAADPSAAPTFALRPSVALNGTDQGSKRIRLGIDPWAYETTDYVGKFIGDPMKQRYLYVIAGDGSLRIIDVFTPGLEQECETNFDPLDPQKKPTDPNMPITPVSVAPTEACIPYGKVNRRQYWMQATTGLRFPTIPVDVAAANLSGDGREDTVEGGHAWVLTASGTIYLVNINPTQRRLKAVVPKVPMNGPQPPPQPPLFPFPPPSPTNPFTYPTDPFSYMDGVTDNVADPNDLVSESPPYPNQPRDRNVLSFTTSLDPSLGPTRLDLPPLGLVTGPYVEPLYTQGTELDATAMDPHARQTYVSFPDRNAAVAQGWDITWQGTVISPRYSGILHGNVLRDDGGNFCYYGVLPGDIVTLRGCMTDADCPLGLVCDRDESVGQVSGGDSVTGLCISSNNRSALTTQCAPFASSLRRYDIKVATPGKLTLEPHLDEIVRSSLTPCRIVGATGSTGTAGTGGTSGTGGGGGMAGVGGMGGAAGTGGMGGAGGAAGAAGMSGSGGGAGTGGRAGTGGTTGSAGTTGAGGTPEDDCFDSTDNSTRPFECINYGGENRCLYRCTRDQDCRRGRVCQHRCKIDSDCPISNKCASDGMCHARPADLNACDAQHLCPHGEACMDGQCEIQSVCADAPPLENGPEPNGCFPQLTSYQVNVNAGFLVTGTQAGSFAAGTTDKDWNCQPDSARDSRLVSRIPLRPYPGQDANAILCDQPMKPVFPTMQTNAPAADGYYIDHFDPALKPAEDPMMPGKLANLSGSTRQEAPQLVEWMQRWTTDVSAPNACIYFGGPIASDGTNADPTTRAGRPQHIRARFRNTQVAFVLADIDRGPPGASTIHFDVHGGFRQEAVVNLTTVQISAPARLVLGPIDSTRPDNLTTKAAPFFFVVDQRRLGTGQGGGPTRGQIVRVNPFGLAATNGYLPVYEDYRASSGLFPIQ